MFCDCFQEQANWIEAIPEEIKQKHPNFGTSYDATALHNNQRRYPVSYLKETISNLFNFHQAMKAEKFFLQKSSIQLLSMFLCLSFNKYIKLFLLSSFNIIFFFYLSFCLLLNIFLEWFRISTFSTSPAYFDEPYAYQVIINFDSLYSICWWFSFSHKIDN